MFFFAATNISRVGQLFKKDLSHDFFFFRTKTQAMLNNLPCFEPFSGFRKLQRPRLKNGRKIATFAAKI
jgi:hypothetical protein